MKFSGSSKYISGSRRRRYETTSSRNSSRSWFPIIIFLARSILPLEVGRIKDFGHIEPNATVVRRQEGGTLERSADETDGVTGGLWSYLGGGHVSLHGAEGEG